MTTLVTVNGSALDQNGIAYPNAIITYALTLTDIDPTDGYIVPEQKTVRSDAAGNFTLSLWPNALGSKGSQYRVVASSTDGKLLFDLLATVPYDATPGAPNIYDLSDISVSASCDDCSVDGSASADVAQAIADAIAALKAEPDPFPQYAEDSDLALVATTGSFGDLVDEPQNTDALPAGTTNLYMTGAEKMKLSGIAAGAEANVQSDWNQASAAADDFIKNKPTIPTSSDQLTQGSTNLFLTSAERTKLTGVAAGAEVNVQPDWNQTDNTKDDFIKNKPNLDPSFINWAPLTGNITLTDADNGKSFWVTANATVTMPTYTSLTAGWQVEFLMSDDANTSAFTLTFLPQGTDTMRAGVATLTGDGAVGASYNAGEFLVIGVAPPDDGLLTESDPVFVASPAYGLTTADIIKLGNQSGINTGDQDLSGYALKTSIGAASGIAPLGADSKVPAANLPTMPTMPGASVDSTLTAFSGTTGAVLKDTGIKVDANDNLSGQGTKIVTLASGNLLLGNTHKGCTIVRTGTTGSSIVYIQDSVANSIEPGFKARVVNQGGATITVQAFGTDTVSPSVTTLNLVGVACDIVLTAAGQWVVTSPMPISLNQRSAILARQAVTISGDTTLTSGNGYQDLVVSADAVLTLPDYASLPSGWWLRIIPDDSEYSTAHAITLTPAGTDTVTATKVKGVTILSASPATSGQFSVSDAGHNPETHWQTVAANLTLTDADHGKTLFVTANCTITLPVHSTCRAGWKVKAVPDDSATATAHTITLAVQSTDTVRGSVTSITGDISLGSTPTAGVFAAGTF